LTAKPKRAVSVEIQSVLADACRFPNAVGTMLLVFLIEVPSNQGFNEFAGVYRFIPGVLPLNAVRHGSTDKFRR
jgi:hypothetical protein